MAWPPFFFHHRKARHIGRSVTDVDHVWKRDGANVGVHVVIYILRRVEPAFVNTKKKLRLLGVTDHALGKSDPALFVLGKFAAENGAHIRLQTAAVEQHLQPG